MTKVRVWLSGWYAFIDAVLPDGSTELYTVEPGESITKEYVINFLHQAYGEVVVTFM